MYQADYQYQENTYNLIITWLYSINSKYNINLQLLKDKNRIADMRVTYLVDGDNTKFYSMYLDKMKMTEVDYLILKVKAFGSYDSTNL